MPLLATALILIGTTTLPAATTGEESLAELTPYLTENVNAIAMIDLEQIDTEKTADLVTEFLTLGGVPASQISEARVMAVNFMEQFTEAGGQRIYVLASMADIPDTPYVFVRTSKSADKSAITRMLQLPGMKLESVKATKDGVVAGPKSVLDRMGKSDAPKNFQEAFVASGPAAIKVMFLPSEDDRRVLAALAPRLPQVYGGVDGAAIAKGMRWASLSVWTPPELSAKLIIQGDDAASAKSVEKLLSSLLAIISKDPKILKAVPGVAKVFERTKPKATGQQVELRLGKDDARFLLLSATPAVEAARTGALRTSSMNNLKHIGLAFHNYHATYIKFPAQANYDKEKKPLLSWRVHILPYIDQTPLYSQFHLDEPWDSDHNKKLIAKMPEIFADPTHDVPGRTTYQGLQGKGMLFDGKEALQIRDFTDGTSNTILVVKTPPEKAVVWTQPVDFAVDLTKPREGLFAEGKNIFLALFCDGAAFAISKEVDEEQLRRMFQRNDGKTVNH